MPLNSVKVFKIRCHLVTWENHVRLVCKDKTFTAFIRSPLRFYRSFGKAFSACRRGAYLRHNGYVLRKFKHSQRKWHFLAEITKLKDVALIIIKAAVSEMQLNYAHSIIRISRAAFVLVRVTAYGLNPNYFDLITL